MRKFTFENGQYYHIYNRGVDKRDVFLESPDFERFLWGLVEFNNPLTDSQRDFLQRKLGPEFGTRYLVSNSGPASSNLDAGSVLNDEGVTNLIKLVKEKLVEITAYALLPNHYHLLIRQLTENGIPKFLQKIGTGYTNYFNLKNKRSGCLFQGKYKAIHLDSNDFILRTSSYINANAEIHGLISDVMNYQWCSYQYYLGLKTEDICKNKNFILEQFKDADDYKNYVQEVTKVSRRKKLEKYLAED
jgi:REP element-mobilizing transposase RayT